MFIVSVVKLMNFKPQIALRPFSEKLVQQFHINSSLLLVYKKEKLLQMCQLDS